MTADFPVVFALYPRITQLDFTGPFEVLARLPGARCVLASVEGGTIQADGGITFAGVVRLADVAECALLCVPGGFGTVAALENQPYLAQLRRLGAQAQFITSVCTGSLLLAAAGLLRGKKAACHWAWRELLSEFAVMPDAARVVRDGNVITGGGGAPLYDVDKPPEGITQKVASTENFVRVRVDGKKANVEAITPDGTTIDEFELEGGSRESAAAAH